MKLICPRCMKPVTVPDDFTGRELTCPSCQKPFDAPTRYTPAVLPEPEPTLTRLAEPPMSPALPPDRPLPPPGFVPPASTASSLPPSAAVPPLAGYTHAWGVTISPKIVAWLPAVLLTITLFSTFFPWVGAYYVGHSVYSQGPWQALFGIAPADMAVVDKIPGDWVKQLTSDWELMLPFVLVLLLAVVLAWVDRFPKFDPDKIPPLVKMWPWRKAIIAALAGFAFVLIFTEVAKGFGMERAIYRAVHDDPAIARAREEAGSNMQKLQDVQNKEQQELARYNLKHSCWETLGLWSNLLASLAMLLSICLDRRGSKPPPKVLLHY